jgi:FkbH-like protein
MEKQRETGRTDPKSAIDALARADSFSTLHRALSTVDLDKLTARDYNALSRAVQGFGGEPDVKVAYLSNFTLDLLPRYVDVYCAREGIRAGAYVGGFGQYVQEILDEDSPLIRYRPDVVFLSLSLRLLRPERMASFSFLTAAERRELKEEIVAHLESWASTAAERLPTATILITNFTPPSFPAAGVADTNLEYGQAEFYLELNLDLLRRFKGNPRVQIFDNDRVCSRFGKDRILDPKMYFLAKMEWSPAFLPAVACELLHHLRAIQGRCRKCVVLDLDNTLWGGVVGEEGPAGVKIGTGDPEGEAFLDLHYKLKSLQARGVLLAICSKNNPADVQEVFATRPEIPLRLEDFAAMEIGWGPKHEGLRRIASALNIGTDSLVFVDDNPAEVSLIQQMMPEVRTVLLPADPAEYPLALERLSDFEKLTILEEDVQKTAKYRENRQRQELRAASGDDLAAYLASLGTDLTICRARKDDLPRVHQLFAKTNQFNLTTQRYSPGEVDLFATSPACELWVAQARDRFGDMGTVGVALLKKQGRTLLIDSLLLSCRAMGRGIETALMNHIKGRLLEGTVGLELRGRFVPTPKNKPVESFYEEQGFRVIENRPSGERVYVLRRSEIGMKACDWIRVVTEEVPAGLW